LLVPGAPACILRDGAVEKIEQRALEALEIEPAIVPALSAHALKLYRERKIADSSYSVPGLGRFRINLHRERGAAAAAVRALPAKVPMIGDLHLPPSVAALAKLPRGLVLIGGPAGSGKSTTMAALVNEINRNESRHVLIIEDPVEYQHRHFKSIIEQVEIGEDAPDFPTALRAALRQAPDVIVVGEMRDAETMMIAVAAAETGHLVLSTLHTTNAALAVTRILDFFKPDERDQVRRQVAATLQAVICQRMVPTIAGSMTPAQEIMINSGTIRKLIEENRLEKLGAAIETGGEEGMINFNQHLFQLVKDGKVSQKDALAKATNAQALEMNFQGIFLTEGKRILG